MAEFDEVGRTVENFASEDATVVIGTVLDPDMQDEVKVTVVATGLNRAVSRQSARGERAEFHEQPSRRPHVQLINTQAKRDGTTGMVVEDGFAPVQPSFAGGLRSRSADAAPATAAAELPSDYLDIPAFLRRQAD